jgi:hypothetical protein
MEIHAPHVKLLDRAKVQAEVLVPLLHALEDKLGKPEAHTMMRDALSTHFRALARHYIAEAGGNEQQAMMKMNGDAGVAESITMEFLDPGDDMMAMNVTECQYAKFFKELGEPELGFMLLCSADFDFDAEATQFDLKRTQTIMQGADHCDFRYALARPAEG